MATYSNIKIDLNADVGEGYSSDATLMPFITSANIACGSHAGDRETMKATIDLCLQYGVHIGAHPSFPDKTNFGRKDMHLSAEVLRLTILEQLQLIQEICKERGTEVHHIKPHGALYNMSAKNKEIAQLIAETVFQFNPQLKLFGLSGSHSIAEGVMAGLETVAEVFADRTYQDDGSLTPRDHPVAVIDSAEKALAQALQMTLQHEVTTISGISIPILTESICLHGDTPHAVSFARLIYQTFTNLGISIQAFP